MPDFDESLVEPKSDEAAEQPRTYSGETAVPVEIIKDSTPEKVRAATYGGWQSYQFAGTEVQPVRVLRFDERRRRALLFVTPGAAGNIVGNLYVGSLAQVGSGNPAASGAVPLVSGQQLEIQSASDVYCLPNGVNSLFLGVLDEIYRD